MPDHVRGVVCRDTGKPLDDLINAECDRYAIDPVGLTGLLIAESGLAEHALREGVWPDYSAGLSQPILLYIQASGVPTPGLVLDTNAGVALDTPTNRQRYRDWCWVAENLIPYTAARWAPLYRRAAAAYSGFDVNLMAACFWNAPGYGGWDNPTGQYATVKASYRAALVQAEQYRAPATPTGPRLVRVAATTTAGLRLRAGPDTNTPELQLCPPGWGGVVLGEQDGWLLVATTLHGTLVLGWWFAAYTVEV